MKCNEARRFMSPYLDSELGATKTFEVSDHLRHCPECDHRFSSERVVDDLMRHRLERDPMPAELWARITRKVSTPPWLRRLRSGPALALAATVVLAFVGTTMVNRRATVPAQPWIASLLKDAAPTDRAFVATSVGVAAARETLRADFGLRFAGNSEAGSTLAHRLELVSASSQKDAMGREFTEVRLNCCGKPVILVLARPAEDHWPQPIETTPGAAAAGGAGLRVATRELRGIRAVAVAHHPVGDVLASLQFIST